jgi:hypothetical protein
MGAVRGWGNGVKTLSPLKNRFYFVKRGLSSLKVKRFIGRKAFRPKVFIPRQTTVPLPLNRSDTDLPVYGFTVLRSLGSKAKPIDKSGNLIFRPPYCIILS